MDIQSLNIEEKTNGVGGPGSSGTSHKLTAGEFNAVVNKVNELIEHANSPIPSEQIEDLSISVDNLNNELLEKLEEHDELWGNREAINSKFDKSNIVNTTGQNTDKVMSQKAVTAQIQSLQNTADDLENAIDLLNERLSFKSQSEFEAMQSFNPDKVYFVYEDEDVEEEQ